MTPDDILRTVSERWNVPVLAIQGQRKAAHLIRPRWAAIYLLRDLLGLSYAEIGRLMGGRDHSTVMHGRNRAGHLIVRDAAFAQALDDCWFDLCAHGKPMFFRHGSVIERRAA